MKKVSSFIISVCIIFALIVTVGGSFVSYEAKAASVDVMFTIDTDNYVLEDGVKVPTFEYGEPIKVTPYENISSSTVANDNKDWIGIAPKGQIKNGATAWSYISAGVVGPSSSFGSATGRGSGVQFDFRESYMPEVDANKMLTDYPVGDYTIFWVPNNGGATACTQMIDIKIVPGKFEIQKNVNGLVFNYGESINVTPYEDISTTSTINNDNMDWIGVVPYGYLGQGAFRWSYITTGVGKGKYDALACGRGTGVTLDIRSQIFAAATANGAKYTYENFHDFPAGSYTLYWAPNNGSYSRWIHFKVVGSAETAPPVKPASISYTLDDKTTALAGGNITVTYSASDLGKSYSPTHFIYYWADDNGKLNDYTYIGVRPIKGTSTMVSMPDVTLIPEKATRIIAYSLYVPSSGSAYRMSTEFASVALPTDRAKKPAENGKLISSFQIVSDAHVASSETHPHSVNWKNMLADIKEIDPNTKGIFFAGDNTVNGREAEHKMFYDLWAQSGLAPVYMCIGNHEFKADPNVPAEAYKVGYSAAYKPERDRFLKYVNMFLTQGGYDAVPIPNDSNLSDPYGKILKGPYYDLWMDGFHFIFLGSEYAGTNSYISDEQLAWLDQKLAESRNANRPSFVFVHASLYNTIAGGMPNQTWNGLIAGDANWNAWKAEKAQTTQNDINERNMLDRFEKPFRDILNKYPEAMMFSGHSHWEMSSSNNIYEPTNPTDVNNKVNNYLFNTSSVGYLASDVRHVGSESLPAANGSEGYYVKVYENCIEFWGREFIEGKWIPNAVYRISTFGANGQIDYDLTNHCTQSANGHEYVFQNQQDKTCTANGSKAHYECKHCGKLFTKNGEVYTEVNAGDLVIPAGHDLINVQEQDKTCTQDGYTAHKACENCDYTEGKTIIPASHDLIDVQPLDKTCTQDGYTAHKACEHCDYTEGKTIIPAGHDYVYHAEDGKTCTANGTREHYSCEDCDKLFIKNGEVYTEVSASDLIIPASHDLIDVQPFDKTCTQDGYTAHKACENCDYTEGKTVIPAGHDYVYVEEDGKTCTTNGTKEHYTCQDCDKLFIKNETEYTEVTASDLVIPASHDLIDVQPLDKTCTEDGYTAHKACEHCDYTEGKTIIPAGHDLYDVDAQGKTCTQDGYTAHKACQHCDYTEGKTIIPASHDLYDVDAQGKTCTQDGYTAHKACEYCDYTEGKTIIPASHEYSYVAEVPATANETGVKAHYKCLDCEEVFLLVDGEYQKVTENDLIISKVPAPINGCAGQAMEIFGLISILCAVAFLIKKNY